MTTTGKDRITRLEVNRFGRVHWHDYSLTTNDYVDQMRGGLIGPGRASLHL